MNQQGSMSQIIDGMAVFDAAGEKVGTVRGYDTQAGILDVEKGWLFPRDFYVPAAVVDRSDAEGVYLTIYKDDLSSGRYDDMSTGDTMETGGGLAATATNTNTMQAPMAMPDATATGERLTADAGEDIVVPEYEERLVAGKRQEETGRVHLHKDVVEEQQTVRVPLQREEVTVERVEARGTLDPNAAHDAFTEQDIDVPVMGETAVIGKEMQQTGEVHLHKQTVMDEQEVSDTVRKEHVTVDGAQETLRQERGTREP